MSTNTESTWHGVPITELSREELIAALEYCGKELVRVQEDRRRWMKAADPLKYLGETEK